MPRDAEGLNIEQQADLASLLYELGHNPQTRDEQARLIAKIDPQRARASFPDVVQRAQFAELKRDIDQKFAREAAEKDKARQEAQRAKLRERYSEEQLAEIAKERTRLGGGNWEDAAIIYASKNPEADPRYQPPPQSERPGAKWEFPTVPGKDGKPMSFKDFAADPRGASMDAAYSIIHEFKNRNLSSGFRR